MAARRKFGTFGGVFTPAILTILGVIMYMRLPWIVGNAGITATIGIVIVAHVISVTTGLSVSSIATDKRVKAGGSYYIISRALGLPIGGTLGIALFVGLSFSVSLYLIGFSESFLQYFDLPNDKDAIRICGTVSLIAVTTITFISTSLAIKTQYFIMAAIAISLGSIFVGSGEPWPEQPMFEPPESGAPLAVLFGIFFPAVTGFEAGVSMSGDLKDPKKSIPGGTLAAIFFGLVVYIALALFLGYRIPADQLANNPRVLLEYSWLPWLVVPGIWGATISSSLGSILGAPRILQACAMDRIGPRFLAKGVGPDNEPRNALLLTFVIAEAGILIGELDVIARVVSMFFMASYAFLNLSAAIEAWVSPDFRPDFRIPKTVSVIGAATCILLMIQLDILAMMGSLLVLGILFLLLSRQQLVLETGDTWNGVWSSLVRAGLERLGRSETHERNWRPHVLAFTDGDHTTVLQLGTAVVQKRGVMTEFQLVDGEAPPSDDPTIHRERTDDRFATMQAISRFHGLPGLEPNTVLTDWSFLQSDPERAAGTLQALSAQGRNLVLSVMKGEQYTGGAQIDVWWQGPPRNLALALSLVRFLTLSDEWRSAQVRFLAAVADPSLKRGVQQRIAQWLREARLEAEVRVLDSPPEGQFLEDLVATVSGNATMVMIGLPDELSAQRLARTAILLGRSDRTVLLLGASPVFADPFPAPVAPQAAEEKVDEDIVMLPPVGQIPADEALAVHVTHVQDGLEGALDRFVDQLAAELGRQRRALADEVERVGRRAFSQLARSRDDKPLARRRMTHARVQLGTLHALQAAVARYREAAPEQHQVTLAAALSDLSGTVAELERAVAEEIELTLTESGEPVAGRAEGAGRFQVRRVSLRREMVRLVDRDLVPGIDAAGDRARQLHHRGLDDLDGLITWTLPALGRAVERLGRDGADADLSGEQAAFDERLAQWREREQEALRTERREVLSLSRVVTAEICDRIRHPPGRALALGGRAAGLPALEVDAAVERLQAALDLQGLVLARTTLDLSLQSMHHRLRTSAAEIRGRLENNIRRGTLAELGALHDALVDPSADLAEIKAPALEFDERALVDSLLGSIEEAVAELPETLETLGQDAFQDLAEGRLDDLEPVTIEVRRLVSFILESDLVGALREDLAKLGAALGRTTTTVHDVLRFVAAEDHGAEEEKVDVLRSSAERIQRQREGIEQALERLLASLDGVVGTVVDRTQAAAISDAPAKMGRFIRNYQQQQLLGRASSALSAVGARARQGMVNLTYRYTQGVLLARRIQAEQDARTHRVSRALELRLAAAPSSERLEALPIFYRRVFVGASARDPAYWVGQAEELERGAAAIRAHREGHPGGLLVTGPPGAGMSSVAERLMRAHFDAGRTFHVAAPEQGSVDVARFDEALVRALGVAVANLPVDSAVVLHDLELWFERGSGGLAVLDTISELIDTHGHRTLFVLTCNEYAFQLFSRLGRLDDQLMGTVRCHPLDAGSLREAVMRRHETSGLALRLEGEPDGELGEWGLARLFAGLFEASGGWLGPAMHTWLGHVVSVDEEAVTLRRPRALDLDALDALDEAWVALLIELVLHRRRSVEALARICSEPEVDLRRGVLALVRGGLLVENSDGTLQLDPFAAHHVHFWLRTREVL